MQLGFGNRNMMREGGVADQFNPVVISLVVNDGLDHAARVVDGHWHVEMRQFRMRQREGQ